MNNTSHQANTVLARKTDGNPEGKGVNKFQLDWQRSEPRDVVAKPQTQVVADFFTSMLVLSATFKFQPVVGAEYSLYWIDGDWSLSPIAPEQWSPKRQRGFAGSCTLQPDMTWSIAPSELLTQNTAVADAMGRFYDAFAETLNTDLTLEEILPFYVGKAPYYQRLYASALSRSIRTSVTLGNQAALSCRHWQSSLPEQQSLLLALSSS